MDGSALASGFAVGLACGIACGLAMGIAAGTAIGRDTIYKNIKKLIGKGRIRITDNDGNAISGADLTSFLSGKSKKKR
jgi:hypothetical protein